MPSSQRGLFQPEGFCISTSCLYSFILCWFENTEAHLWTVLSLKAQTYPPGNFVIQIFMEINHNSHKCVLRKISPLILSPIKEIVDRFSKINIFIKSSYWWLRKIFSLLGFFGYLVIYFVFFFCQLFPPS